MQAQMDDPGCLQFRFICTQRRENAVPVHLCKFAIHAKRRQRRGALWQVGRGACCRVARRPGCLGDAGCGLPPSEAR
jgi:hypothetical protein